MKNQDKKQEAIEQLRQMREQIDKGIRLTADDKRNLPGMGHSRASFVSATIELLKKEDGFLPRNFNVTKLMEAFSEFSRVKEIQTELKELADIVNDHCIRAGTDSFQQALIVKKLLDNNPQPEFDNYKKELKKHFRNQK